jgi:hypothetical protein
MFAALMAYFPANHDAFFTDCNRTIDGYGKFTQQNGARCQNRVGHDIAGQS